MKAVLSRHLLCGIASVLLLAGCSSITNSHLQKEPMMAAYLSGRNANVAQRLGEKLESTCNTGDELMWRLEAGSFFFNTGDFVRSVNEFERAEKLIEEYDDRPTVSVRDAGSEGGAMLTNLNALPYRGFCRDRIALSVFKSLAYLGEGREESFLAQLRRLRVTQKEVVERYKKFFEAEQKEIAEAKKKNPDAARSVSQGGKSLAGSTGSEEFNRALSETRKVAHRGYGNFLNPAALFLSALGSLREGDMDNARIDFRRLYESSPQNPEFRRCYVTVLKLAGDEVPEELRKVEPFNFPIDRDCVYVLFANGRSAAFRQVAIYFPVMTAYPVCSYYPAPYRYLTVTAGGRSENTVQLADMDAILAQEYDERLPGMITRIILSTAIKEGASYAGAWAVSRENEAAGAAVLIGSMIYRAAFNTADTRSWEILPKEFQLAILPMPEDRRVTVAPDGNRAGAVTLEIPKRDRSAIIYVNAPSAGAIHCRILGMPSK
ncbi:MAG: hypothetical protein HPZ91_10860 [Lentisphaeria bacterium]|nr:hypothetical protein [Lentisphaeria bacterium]